MNWKIGCFAALSAVLACSISAAEVLNVKVNPRNSNGARIDVGNTPLVKGTKFTVHPPDWSVRYVRNIRSACNLKVDFRKTENGFFQSVTETIDNVAILDEYSVECAGDTATFTAVASMKKDRPASVESVFGLAPWVCENAKYEIVLPNGKTRTGVIPEEAGVGEETRVLPPFVKGVFSSTRGIVTVEVVEGPALCLEDRRTAKVMGWRQSYILWGYARMPAPGKSFRQVVRIALKPPVNSARKQVKSSIPRGSSEMLVCPATSPAEFPLLPYPRKCRFTGVDYKVQSGDKLTIPGGSARFARHAKKFADRCGLEVVAGPGTAARGIRVVYGSDMDDESYTVKVDADGATVRAKGERGAFYALWTLRGLYRNGAFKGAEIDDAPAFARRAIHANADSDTKVFMGEMVEKVFAPLKINTIILECPYVQWEATKGKWRRRGMPKEDLPAFLDLAEEYYIKVYPLIPTFSHSEWFFWNKQDRELMENPRDARSYNSLDPRVYEKLAVLFDEVLEAFRRPEYFHISHDELDDNPTREEGKKIGVAELFYRDIMWHYDFFKKRGVKLMMWHDMLIGRTESKWRYVANARGGTDKIRKKLPKDISICMWNYNSSRDGRYFQIDIFQEDGFPVWGAGWFDVGCLEQLSAYAEKKGAVGMIETTWHNKVGSGTLLQTQYSQLTAYVRAAALFWNPGYRPLPDPAKVYVELMRPEGSPAKQLYPLPVNCNTVLAGDGDGFEKLPERLVTADGMVFRLAKPRGGTGAVMVRSSANPDLPGKVRIPVNGKCRRMYLLQTTLDKALRQDLVAVKLVFRYKDGGVEIVRPRNDIDIGYGSFREFKEQGKVVPFVYEVATPRAGWTFFMNHHNVFEWRNTEGRPRRIWYMTWENPHPERELDHLLVEAVPDGCGYALLAVNIEKP